MNEHNSPNTKCWTKRFFFRRPRRKIKKTLNSSVSCYLYIRFPWKILNVQNVPNENSAYASRRIDEVYFKNCRFLRFLLQLFSFFYWGHPKCHSFNSLFPLKTAISSCIVHDSISKRHKGNKEYKKKRKISIEVHNYLSFFCLWKNLLFRLKKWLQDWICNITAKEKRVKQKMRKKTLSINNPFGSFSFFLLLETFFFLFVRFSTLFLIDFFVFGEEEKRRKKKFDTKAIYFRITHIFNKRIRLIK